MVACSGFQKFGNFQGGGLCSGLFSLTHPLFNFDVSKFFSNFPTYCLDTKETTLLFLYIPSPFAYILCLYLLPSSEPPYSSLHVECEVALPVHTLCILPSQYSILIVTVASYSIVWFLQLCCHKCYTCHLLSTTAFIVLFNYC